MFTDWRHPTIGIPTIPVSAVVLAHHPEDSAIALATLP